MKKLIAGLALLITTGVTQASFYRANELLEWCETPKSSDACLGYISGATDVLTSDSEGPLSAEFICMPASVTTGQILKVYVKYANDNPEKLHYSASILLANALVTAFPCESQTD